MESKMKNVLLVLVLTFVSWSSFAETQCYFTNVDCVGPNECAGVKWHWEPEGEGCPDDGQCNCIPGTVVHLDSDLIDFLMIDGISTPVAPQVGTSYPINKVVRVVFKSGNYSTGAQMANQGTTKIKIVQ